MYRVRSTPLLSALLVGLMLTIFAIDTFSPLDMAIAVMYVVVVLLSASMWQRRGVLFTAEACLALALLSYIMTHSGYFSPPAVGRLVASLAAIGITTFLALRGLDARNALLAREEALHKLRVQLAHASRVTMLGELAASIAHEVNQPLAAIAAHGQASLRWMDRPQPDLNEVRCSVNAILEASSRATDVIKRIRALARRSEPQRMELELNQVAEECVTLLWREMSNHRVALMLELAPELPPVRGDRVELQQVVINLMMNAVQAMSHCAPGEAVLVLRTLRLADGGQQLSVSDSGHGIPAEQLPRLFEPFYSTKTDGMGMGLPICRSIIENHGGRIWARDDGQDGPASGATVAFSLPEPEAALP